MYCHRRDGYTCSEVCPFRFAVEPRPCGLADQQQCSEAWGGGKPCSKLAWTETGPCDVSESPVCPSDCKVSSWSAWSTCTVSCGKGGRTRRVRSVTVSKAGDGKQCPALHEEEACNTHRCGALRVCHSKHVRCKLHASQKHVVVTHDRQNMETASQFSCKHNGHQCQCSCSRAAGSCCLHADSVLAHVTTLRGNVYAVSRPSGCCSLCRNHPSCLGFEFEDGLCSLKSGTSALVVPLTHTSMREGRHAVAGLVRGQPQCPM